LDPNVKDYKIEMPGLWFSQSEATALALMEHLLSSLDQSGLLGPHIQPLRAIIDNILGPETPSKELRKRIKVLGMFSRKTSIDNFGEIGAAAPQLHQSPLPKLGLPGCFPQCSNQREPLREKQSHPAVL
jgi:hypothetical protein